MNYKQILFRIIYALTKLHELEESFVYSRNNDVFHHKVNVIYDLLFDVKLQLEQKLNEKEKVETNV